MNNKNHNSNKCHQQCKTKFQHILTNIITYLKVMKQIVEDLKL